MNKFLNFVYNNFFRLILVTIVFLIALINYQLGTWLTGWDNLHPEFDFWLNIKRSLIAVWQEYQGLGLVGGMGHASDLFRQIFLLIFSLLIPLNFLRYFYTFLMLLLGLLGLYNLIAFLFRKYENYKIVAFLGSLFYLSNLATIQIFYTPFGTFITHFGFLPWLVLFFIKFLEKPVKKNIFWFVLINILAIPQSYVPTMFLVYLFALVLVFLGFLFNHKKKGNITVRFFKSLGLIFILNAFWLLPFLYFNITNIKNPLESHNNFMSTEDIYLKNRKFGDLKNTIILKSFWFDYIELSGDKYQYLMAGWRQHLSNPYILFLGYGFFGLVIIGFFYLLFKKPKYWLSFLLLFITSFGLLANNTVPFSWFDKLWRKAPMISQVFRVPFTKFANLAAFSYSIFFSFAIYWLMIKTSFLKRKWQRVFPYLAVFIVSLGLCAFVFPVFKGELFYRQLRQDIPADYFALFEFLKTQDKNTRIANFPQANFWGWRYYQWGYLGSGFLWYGINQPILDRAFDVWSSDNENYYWEVNQAIYANNLDFLDSILEKYQINYLILDKNIRETVDYKALRIDEIETKLTGSSKINLIKEFGRIKVYQVALETPVKDYIYLSKSLPLVEPRYDWNNDDNVFRDNGHYLSSDNLQASYSNNLVYFPFRSLFTGRKQEELEFKVKEGFNSIIFSNQIPAFNESYQFIIPKLEEEEAAFWTPELKEGVKIPGVYLNNNIILSFVDEQASQSSKSVVLPNLDKGEVEVIVDKQKGYFSYDSLDDREFLNTNPKSCNPFNTGFMEKNIIDDRGKKLLRLSSLNSSNCLAINLPYFIQKTGYLVKVESRWLMGNSILFYITNLTSKSGVIETYLPKNDQLTPSYFIIPPMEDDGIGYSLHFDNVSIGRQKTINDLGRIEVYPMPYNLLKEIKIVPGNFGRDFDPFINNADFKVSHPNPSFYQIEILVNLADFGLKNTLVLSQSYHQGWIAWSGKPVFGKKLDHVLVNNWENGWQLNGGETKVYLFFWPQILEYLGLALLLIFPFVFILKQFSCKSSNNRL